MAVERHVRAKAILAANVQALLDREQPPHARRGRRGQIPEFLDKRKMRNRLSKVQRAVKDGSVNMDTVEELARLFKVEPYQLLIDKLDVAAPQVAVRQTVLESARRIASDLGDGE